MNLTVVFTNLYSANRTLCQKFNPLWIKIFAKGKVILRRALNHKPVFPLPNTSSTSLIVHAALTEREEHATRSSDVV